MRRRPSLTRRLGTAARWPVGVGLTSWRYMWRTTPLHRSELPGRLPDDAPPPIPDGPSRDELQPARDGVGPLFHRIYRARMQDARLGSEELIAAIAADPDRVAPTEFASFAKVLGSEGSMVVGDEYARNGELLEFRIESWARAGDRLSNLLYDHLRMSKEVQLHMWTSVLEQVAELSGGRLTGGIEIRTHRVDGA